MTHLLNKPSWGFWKPWNGSVKNDNEDELQCQRDPPGSAASQKRESVGDPIGQAEACDVHDLERGRLRCQPILSVNDVDATETS
jgi:hypothetical protein